MEIMSDYSELVERLKISAEDSPSDYSITDAIEAITTLQRQLAEAREALDIERECSTEYQNNLVNESFVRAEYEETIAAQREEIKALRDALSDMLSGWKYIREVHGDLYGVGWDCAQSKAEAAIASAEA